jgi:hypothetical protein
MAVVILFPTSTMYLRLVFNSDLGKLENEECSEYSHAFASCA